MAQSYQVRYEFDGKGRGEPYTLDHAANLFLLDRTGKLTGVVPYGLPSAALVDALRRALDGRETHPEGG